MQDKLKNPVIFNIFKILEHGSSIKCFIELFEAARSGKLADHKTFKELCDMFADRFHLTNSTNPNLKNSICQYNILTLQLVGYKGLIVVAGNCTKVHPHSTLPLDEYQIDKIEDIKNIINSIYKAEAEATQVTIEPFNQNFNQVRQ
ncbi:uncharacterized protein F5147DRAFT_659073 [Suillus discolor]|uniref:Uncharacterized protein n=1 Tax=Suillus discolor TaxID=1912936 RepID=A0A9P7JM06_9AGAM|nr:uncharacterized protein F5147DRAFT_659073 [Suillus discolor]KAG2086952.1 hypothetical protein F5147DRAFT_659073 [Suillus discolor]